MTAKNILQAGVICLLLFFGNREASAQSYLLRYVTTTYGAVTFTGNTLGLAKATGQNRPGALDSIGAFTTLNTNSIVGTGTVPGPTTYPFGTTTNWTNNSSAAVLQIPTNSTILYAELIWAGTAQITTNTSPAGDVLSDLNTPVKFILPNGTTNSITPDPATASLVTNGTSAIFYVRSANVTALVQSTGAGTYAAGGVPGIVLATEDANNACGWTLAVVYGNSTLHYRNLSLFIGNSFAISGGTPPNPAVVSGFSTPFTGTVSGRLSVSAVEGDPNKTGDQMLFGPTTNTLAVLSGPNNITNNFFASQINGDTGLLDTSGTFGLSNSVPPTVGFSARQGWDITSVDVSFELSNGLTNAYAQNITQGDGYSVNALALEIDAQPEADVALFKNGPANVQAGSNATYTITLTNLGPASASNVVTSDNLPASTSFVSASGGGTPSGNVVTWPAITNFPVGASSNFTVTVTSSGGVFTNSASSTAATTDPNPANNNGTGTSNKVITRANRPPVAVNDTASTFKNTSVTVAVLANDSDPDGDPLTIVSVSPTNGTASIVGGTNVMFTPAAGFVGTATVSYTISDGNGGTASASISVSVLDHPPVANGQSVTTVQGAPKATVLTGSDADNDPLTFVIVSPPANGVLSLLNTNTGAVTYTPNAGFAGTDSFTFLVNDGTSNSAPATVSISVTVQADVAVFKTGPASVFAGTNFTYTITVTNLGPGSASNVVASDVLPTNVVFVSASPGGVTNSGVVSWTLGTLANGGTSNLTVTVTAPPIGTITNTATVNSTTPDPTPGNNTSVPVGTAVTPLADVAVTDSGPSNVLAGGSITYTVTVTNSGPSTASNVVVSDSLPVNVVFTGAGSGGTNNGGVVTWPAIPVLTNGQVVTFNVTGTAPASGTLTDTAYGTSPTADPNLGNNNGTSPAATVITAVTPVTDLAVGKSGPAGSFLGANFSYTIAVTNFGPSTATGLSVTDSLPAGLVFMSSLPSTTTNANNQVIWTGLGNLAAGATTNLALNVTAALRTAITNIASVGSPTFDPSTTNNSSLPVITTITNRPPVAVNDTASTYKNTSVTVAVLANDSDPDGDPLTIVSVSPTNGTASIVGGTNVMFTPAAGFVGTATVSYTISDGHGGTATGLVSVSVLDHPPVANGQSVTTVQGAPKATVLTGSDADNDPLTFVIVSPPANGVLSLLNTNTGAVTYTPNAGFAGTDSFTFLVNDGTSNSAPATVSISVTAQADVAVFKTGPASVFAGTNFTYTITVTNNGPSTATNIVVTDQLPVGFAFVSTAPATATISNNFVILPKFNLANNTQTNFAVTVISANGGNFTNVAFATSDTPDPNPANNNGTLTNSQTFTTVTPLADVAVFKTGGTNVAPGGTVNYIITVTNNGPSTASNIVVRDTLPAGAAFQSASGSFTLSNNIVMWSGMTLAEDASVNFNVALTAPASGSFINIASSTSDTLDSNTNNNNGSSSTSQVGTTVTPVADVIVLLSAPTNILLGDSFVYSISVINNGPSPAVNVVVTDSLPVNLTFDSASAGGLLTNGIVTWPAISFLTNGGSTNFTITVTGTNAGTFTNVAFAVSSTFDPDLTNNNGTSSASQIATTVAPAMLAFIVGTQTLNPQSGLVEEPVTVTNIGTVTVDGVRLLVGNLPNGVTLYNAAGTTNGLAYAESDLPLSPGGTVKFVLEFYDHTVAPPFPNTLTVVAILPPPSPPLTSNKVPINRIFVDTRIAGDTRFVIEFNTIAGRTYTIFYSEDLVVWKAATPSITASTDVTQWYDDGPPKTESVPTTIPHRFYQVILSN